MSWEVIDTKKKDYITNLLENALYFINQVPNRKYKVRDFHSSYDLANEIEAAIKKLKYND